MASIRTNDGRLVDPFNPKPEDVRPKVMIHALSQINRFTGHCDWPYSVAQHEINLYRWVKSRYPHLKKAALAHDLAEAWFNDLASPVKKECADYKKAEHKATLFICNELEIAPQYLEELDIFDKRIYKNERNALFRNINELGMGDQYEELPGTYYWWFGERYWSSVRADLSDLFIAEFGKEVFER